MSKAKFLRGFQKKAAKPRTRKEVDAEYADHAIQVGHKMRLISQFEQEVQFHVQRLEALNKEGMSLPTEQPAQPEAEKAAG